MTYFHGFCNLVTSSFFKLGQHFSVANQMNLNSIFSTAVYLISSLTALLISSRPSIFFFFLLIEYKNVPVGSCFRVLLHDVPATILVYGSRQVGVPRNLHTQTLAIVLVWTVRRNRHTNSLTNSMIWGSLSTIKGFDSQYSQKTPFLVCGDHWHHWFVQNNELSNDMKNYADRGGS